MPAVVRGASYAPRESHAGPSLLYRGRRRFKAPVAWTYGTVEVFVTTALLSTTVGDIEIVVMEYSSPRPRPNVLTSTTKLGHSSHRAIWSWTGAPVARAPGRGS